MISVYALIAVILMFVLAIFGFMVVLRRIEKYTQMHGIDMFNYKMEMRDSFAKIVKRDYNARKRDENILRRITKQANYLLTTQALILSTGSKTDGVAKQCRGIDCVARENTNNNKEIAQRLKYLLGYSKRAEEVLELFKAMTEKAKKGEK